MGVFKTKKQYIAIISIVVLLYIFIMITGGIGLVFNTYVEETRTPKIGEAITLEVPNPEYRRNIDYKCINNSCI